MSYLYHMIKETKRQMWLEGKTDKEDMDGEEKIYI